MHAHNRLSFTPEPGHPQISVLIADDHNVVREGLRLLLGAAQDMEVVAAVENGRQAVEKVKELCPQVVLLDVRMPGLNGLEAARQIAACSPETRVLILSSLPDASQCEALSRFGVAGYVLKESAAREVLHAIRQVSQGNAYFSPAIGQSVLRGYQRTFQQEGPFKRRGTPLTCREAEVLQLIAEGYASKQIASELSISIKTVEKHRESLMKKLDLHDVARLTRYAIAHGIISPAAC